MSYYPLFIDIDGKKCLVIGGGKVAERKVLSLLEAGAKVTVISPDVTEGLKQLFNEKKIVYINRQYEKGDLEQAYLVIGATNAPRVNEEVFKEARERKLLVNVVDQPELSTFIVPSQFSRGPLQIAISTSGKSPALAKKIRQDLEVIIGPEYAQYLELIDFYRSKVIAKYADLRRRKEVLTQLVRKPEVLGLIKKGQLKEARKKLEECI